MHSESCAGDNALSGPQLVRRGARALIFDLDGTLIDTVYPHVFAWQTALAEAGIVLDAWRVHRRVGMSGGLFARAVAREVGRPMTAAELVMLSVGLHSGGYGEDELIRAGAFRVYSDPEELRRSLDELSLVV